MREAQAYFFRPRGQQLLQARGDTLARVSRGFVSPLNHRHGYRISLRSATEPIDDTSTGKLMEGVLASFAQFDNDVRSDRTRAGMKAALELGRWTFWFGL